MAQYKFRIIIIIIIIIIMYCVCQISHKEATGGPKSKPLLNNKKIVLNRMKTCE